jgi:hypothetical protein
MDNGRLSLNTQLVNNNHVTAWRLSGFRGATPHLHPASVSHALSRPIDCESHPSQGPGLARLGSMRWMPREREREKEREQAGEVYWNRWNLPENGMLQGVAHVNSHYTNYTVTYLL